MAEEKEKANPEQARKEEKAPAQGKPQAEAPVEEKKEAQEKKKKKINRLTLEELERKIQEVQSKMGGLSSSYALQLLKRKERLLGKTEKDLESGEENSAA